MNELKVSDRVKILDLVDGKNAVKYERGAVIYIGKRVLVQFDSNVCGHDGNGLGKPRHCWMCDIDKVERGV